MFVVAERLCRIVRDRLFGKGIVVLVKTERINGDALFHRVARGHRRPMLVLGYSRPRIGRLLASVGATSLHLLVNGGGLIIVSRTRQMPKVNVALGHVTSGFPSIRLVIANSSSFRLRGHLGRPLAKHGCRCRLFPVSATRLLRDEKLVTMERDLRSQLICKSCPSVVGRASRTGRLLVGVTKDCLCGSLLTLSSVHHPTLLRGLLVTLTLRINDRISCGRLKRAVNSSDGAIRGCVSLLRGYCVMFHLGTFGHGLHARLGGDGGICFCSGNVHGTIVRGFTPLALERSINTL